MRSSTDTTTKTILVLALLAALAVLLRLGENLLPLPVQLGAIRPGLANTITILCLYLFGLRLTGLFLTARVLLVGLLSTGLFTPGFLIGLGGTLLSLLLMEAGRRSQLFSPYGIGILGAAAHNTGQILTANAKFRFILPAAVTAPFIIAFRIADRCCCRKNITVPETISALNSPILHFY